MKSTQRNDRISTMPTSKQSAWALACKFFLWGCPVRESRLDEDDLRGLMLLKDRRAVETCRNDFREIICPYCGMQKGDVVKSEEGLICQCPDCGEVFLSEADCRSWQLKPGWMAHAIRHAMDLSGELVELEKDVVRLGVYARHTVVLSPSLSTVALDGRLMDRMSVKGHSDPYVITPKVGSPKTLPNGLNWLPLEERFALYGDGLTFIPPGHDDEHFGGLSPVHGPFSEDFRIVYLDDEPIRLSKAQAAVFKALWDFAGQPQSAETIMNRAGLSSAKLADIFKVKSRDKGNPRYELRKKAYDRLVTCRNREGLYWMECAADPVSGNITPEGLQEPA
jgi:hypothetical protein